MKKEVVRPEVAEVTKCPICGGMVTVHCILCVGCERAACAGHFVFDPDWEWLCPMCIAAQGGD